ncbi:hypothetical protein [Candidatus Poriferisodalis sp.]|uniref:hypothetical protein n=1 Tax=Candidatus Poriferisodalis sp. TaxID=3101277 RepID=UPI003B519E1E
MTSDKEAARRASAADISATRAFSQALRYLSAVELADLADELIAEAERSERAAERVAEDAPDDETAQGARSLGQRLAFSNRKLSFMARHRDIVCSDPDEETENYGLFCAQCAAALNSASEHCSRCGTSDYVFAVDADRHGFPVIATKPTREEADRSLQDLRNALQSGAIDPSAPIGEIFR